MWFQSLNYRTKAKFTKKYGRGNENEVKLLHGTKSDNIFKICQENFDFKVAGENLSPMYGKGVYFAAESSLSDHYCSEKERDGLKYMLMARVLAGKMGCGSPELRRPPDDCDCAVDTPSKPRIFCVFDYNQLYPEYVIKYKIKQPKWNLYGSKNQQNSATFPLKLMFSGKLLPYCKYLENEASGFLIGDKKQNYRCSWILNKMGARTMATLRHQY